MVLIVFYQIKTINRRHIAFHVHCISIQFLHKMEKAYCRMRLSPSIKKKNNIFFSGLNFVMKSINFSLKMINNLKDLFTKRQDCKVGKHIFLFEFKYAIIPIQPRKYENKTFIKSYMYSNTNVNKSVSLFIFASHYKSILTMNRVYNKGACRSIVLVYLSYSISHNHS